MIGFIGCGNMSNSIINGIVKAGMDPKEIFVSNRSEEKLESISNILCVRTTLDNKEIAMRCRIVFLAVKPNVYPMVLDEIKDEIKEDTVLVTIAAGVTLSDMAEMVGSKVKVVRTMPNTPARVLEGMTAVAANKNVTKEELEEVCQILASFSKYDIIEEKLMNAFISVSGSSMAYVYMFIEAMADGAVSQGMTRKEAYRFAAQAVLGSAKMVLETGEHPGKLKDEVCSPGGTTIEAVKVLEQTGFRGSILAAMDACHKKAEHL